jgi:phosphatidate cytidylyltransferase
MTPVSQDEAAPSKAAEQGSRNLLLRIGAALVLAPAAIAIAYAGGWPWAILATLVAIGLLVEWLTIVGAAKDWRLVGVAGVSLLLSGVALGAGSASWSLFMIALGVPAVAALSGDKRGWTTAGLGYAAAAMIASILLRSDQADGFAALMLVLLIVWVTDIGGYFAGRGIGGPKLWPRVSPKKTWAGAIGGFVLSLAVATGFVLAGHGKLVPFLLLAVVLSTVSQLGDLFESAVKRKFGVKDSSQIIPGHGGLLDRLDGFVAAVVMACLIGLIRGSADGIGRGLMVW